MARTGPTHSPKQKREAVAKVKALYRDHKRVDAQTIVANEYGVLYGTVVNWERRFGNEVDALHAYAPPAGMYAPFVTTSVADRKVELTRDVTTEVFISDVHWHPEHGVGHDPAAYEAMLESLRLIQPDILYFGGDILDAYAPSRYLKDPRLSTPEAFDGEIAYGKERVAELRNLLPDARFVWLTGNHEMRVPKSVMTNAPWLMNRIENIESMLGLSQFDVETVEDGHAIGKLRHYHGDRIAGSGRVNTAKNKFERMLTNMIFGHHHKFSQWLQRNLDGGYHGAYGNGTLHWLTADYVTNPEWQQGFSVIQYARSGNFHVDQVLIHKPSIRSMKAEVIYAGHHVKVDMERAGNGVQVL